MQVSIAQGELRRLLLQVAPAVSSRRRSTLPITRNALLQAKDGQMSATATNLETVIIARARARVSEEGSICIPGRLLADLAGSLRDGDGFVTMRSVCPASKDEPPSLDIERGRSRSRVLGAPAGEFPRLPPQIDGQMSLVLETSDFARATNRVIYAVAKDDSRPVLTSILLEQQQGQRRLVAADGFRLAIAELATGGDSESEFRALVPANTMRIVADAVRNRSGPVELDLAPARGIAQFKIPNLTVITQLLQGTFPNYRQLVPDSYAAQALVTRDELRRAVDICAVFARSGSNIIRLVSHGDELQMFSRSEEVGITEVAIPAEMTGHTQIALNCRYLKDIANAPGSDLIAIETINPSSPGTFRDEDGRKTEVVMPMYVQW